VRRDGKGQADALEALERAREAVSSSARVAEAIGVPRERWANSCHAVSLAIVRSGLLGEPGPRVRVARGRWIAPHPALSLGSQHSWITICPEPRPGEGVPGPYRAEAVIVDPTISFTLGMNTLKRVQLPAGEPGAGRAPGIVVDIQAGMAGYRPHGSGDIWDAGMPAPDKKDEPGVKLTPSRPLSKIARVFLDIMTDGVGPMTRRRWSTLLNGPMCGWPSSELVAAALDTEEIAAIVPIDIAGMVTDRNPQGLYW
jgi:hypothetical protein